MNVVLDVVMIRKGCLLKYATVGRFCLYLNSDKISKKQDDTSCSIEIRLTLVVHLKVSFRTFDRLIKFISRRTADTIRFNINQMCSFMFDQN